MKPQPKFCSVNIIVTGALSSADTQLPCLSLPPVNFSLALPEQRLSQNCILYFSTKVSSLKPNFHTSTPLLYTSLSTQYNLNVLYLKSTHSGSNYFSLLRYLSFLISNPTQTSRPDKHAFCSMKPSLISPS